MKYVIVLHSLKVRSHAVKISCGTLKYGEAPAFTLRQDILEGPLAQPMCVVEWSTAWQVKIVYFSP